MILVDTDIMIDYLRGYKPGVEFIEEKFQFIAVSVFTEMELIIGCRNKDEIKKLKEFLKHFTSISADKNILSDAVKILSGSYLSDGVEIIDSIIAATAKNKKMVLYSKNIKHYKNIKSLKLVKPY